MFFRECSKTPKTHRLFEGLKGVIFKNASLHLKMNLGDILLTPIYIPKSRFFSEGEKVLEIQGKTAHILRLHLQKRTVLILGYLKIYFLQSQNIKTEFLYTPIYILNLGFL